MCFCQVLIHWVMCCLFLNERSKIREEKERSSSYDCCTRNSKEPSTHNRQSKIPMNSTRITNSPNTTDCTRDHMRSRYRYTKSTCTKERDRASKSRSASSNRSEFRNFTTHCSNDTHTSKERSHANSSITKQCYPEWNFELAIYTSSNEDTSNNTHSLLSIISTMPNAIEERRANLKVFCILLCIQKIHTTKYSQ